MCCVLVGFVVCMMLPAVGCVQHCCASNSSVMCAGCCVYLKLFTFVMLLLTVCLLTLFRLLVKFPELNYQLKIKVCIDK